jgi:hypothetical protein
VAGPGHGPDPSVGPRRPPAKHPQRPAGRPGRGTARCPSVPLLGVTRISDRTQAAASANNGGVGFEPTYRCAHQPQGTPSERQQRCTDERAKTQADGVGRSLLGIQPLQRLGRQPGEGHSERNPQNGVPSTQRTPMDVHGRTAPTDIAACLPPNHAAFRITKRRGWDSNPRSR